MKPISKQQVEIHCRRLTWLFILMTAVACTAVPVQEMSDARQAVAAAVHAGASTVAPAQMNAAQTALKMAERLLRDHQYNAARHYARDAHAKAVEAQQIAQSKPGASAVPQ